LIRRIIVAIIVIVRRCRLCSCHWLLFSITTTATANIKWLSIINLWIRFVLNNILHTCWLNLLISFELFLFVYLSINLLLLYNLNHIFLFFLIPKIIIFFLHTPFIFIIFFSSITTNQSLWIFLVWLLQFLFRYFICRLYCSQIRNRQLLRWLV